MRQFFFSFGVAKPINQQGITTMSYFRLWDLGFKGPLPCNNCQKNKLHPSVAWWENIKEKEKKPAGFLQ